LGNQVGSGGNEPLAQNGVKRTAFQSFIELLMADPRLLDHDVVVHKLKVPLIF
jgi:hypothetical protein